MPQSIDVVLDTFKPSDLPESDESRLARLDTLVNPGLCETEFKSLFIQCFDCEAVVARRNTHYHSCPEVKASKAFAPLDRTSLLHCIGTGGVKPESFADLMSFCTEPDCQKFMTYRASLHHDCVFERLHCPGIWE